MTNKIKIASGINLIAGLWLILSAFMMSLGFYSNFFVVGLVVAVLALIELSAMESAAWLGWVNGVLGLWLLVSPLFYAGLMMGALWNSVILGLIILVSALWGTLSAPSTMGHGHPRMG